jgi:hypothetical protein
MQAGVADDHGDPSVDVAEMGDEFTQSPSRAERDGGIEDAGLGDAE